MSRYRSLVRQATAVTCSAVIGLTLGACSSSDDSTAGTQDREAGAYRDSRVCVKNSTGDSLDVGPARDTVGVFSTLEPGTTQCFESNDTALALANASITHPDDANVLASAENFLVWAPVFRVCADPAQQFCGQGSRQQSLFERKLKVGETGEIIAAQGHTYQPRRLADDTYWIVYEVDVLS